MDMSIPKQLAKKRQYQGQLKLDQTSKFTKLDKHFQAIALIIDLKLFQYYSKVIQWTENKQRAMVK